MILGLIYNDNNTAHIYRNLLYLEYQSLKNHHADYWLSSLGRVDMLSLTIGYIIWWSLTMIFIHYFATTFHQATAVLNESGDKGMTTLLTEQLIQVQFKVYVFTIDSTCAN